MPKIYKYKHLKLRFTKEFIESLPKTINPATGCWLYTGYLSNGYGTICIDYTDYSAHRLSATVYHNKDYHDGSWEACHKIECKNKSCFNPTHLYVGTHKDNMYDLVISKTHPAYKITHCRTCGSTYRTYKIKTGLRAGQFQRLCRNCQNVRRRKVR